MQLKEYRREPPKVGHLTFWDCLATPGIVQQKDSSLLACLRFRGPDLYSAVDSALVVQARRLNNLFRRFGGGWGLMTEARRREVRAYPASDWPDPVSRLVDAERRAMFLQPGTFYGTETVLTLVYRRPQTPLTHWKSLLYTNLPADQWEAESLARFDDEVWRVYGLLRDCCEEVSAVT